VYTSGSTAHPKGVIHTSESLSSVAHMITEWCELGKDDCFITGAPVAHVAGLLAVWILPLGSGGKSVLLPRWDAERAASLIDQQRATFSCGATVFLQELVDIYENSDAYDHRLGRFICGGATVPPNLIRRAEEVGIFAFRSWGMTEAPMIGMATATDSIELRSQSDGRVCTGATVEAVDEDRQPLPDGTIGELRLHAPQQMVGYADLELTHQQVDESGWFYSGDLGFVKDGVLTMTGRLKDVINRGGEKFSAQDIEHVIADHTSVSAVAIFGVHDERLGEAVAAAIELRPGEVWPGDHDLASFLSDQGLARQKIPQYWYILDSLPRTASGKVRKEVLRAKFGTAP
jgi:acyl-CoA synthetase